MRIPHWWPLNLWPFCRHRAWSFYRNIFGDEILLNSKRYRSWFKCDDCGLYQLRPYQDVTT